VSRDFGFQIGYQPEEEGELVAAWVEEEEGSSRTTGTAYVWGVTVRSGRGARRVMVEERELGSA
jgi:hypothetical protein